MSQINAKHGLFPEEIFDLGMCLPQIGIVTKCVSSIMALQFTNEEIEKILKTHYKVNLTGNNIEILTKLHNFEVRDSDIFLMGYPRSGTTWAQELVWLIANDLNFEGAKKAIGERFPLLELFAFNQNRFNENAEISEYRANSIKYIEGMEGTRFIKTHVPAAFLPLQIQEPSKNAKIIYIARNVKDTCLSYYHYTKDIIKVYTGDLNDFCKIFMVGKGGLGPVWDHVLYFWGRRNEENVLFLKYEDMKNKLPEEIRKVATFLGKTLNDEQVMELSKWLDFESMKSNPALNSEEFYNKSGFIRKGKVDGFKEEMSAEWIEAFDKWTKNCLEGSGLDMY